MTPKPDDIIEQALSGITLNRILKVAGWSVVGLLITIGMFKMVTVVDANEIVVVQSITGSLTSHTSPGPAMQWFGKVTSYHKRSQFSFSAKQDQGTKKDESLPVTFNDGGGAHISGVISWEMPMSTEKIIKVHQLYGSQEGVEQQLIRPAVERAIYMTGPLMSSAEAYSARKADLLRFFEDQARGGVYQTETISDKQPDAITGIMKTVSIVKVSLDEKGQAKRQSSSQVAEFGIVLLSPAIDNVKFDDIVQKQITEQQGNYMSVQTAKTKALQAEQDAITAEKNGQAAAAKAKWTQEVEKATEVTRAEKERDVAALNVKTAELNKQKLTLEGQGEAAKRQAVMLADGALDKKIAAYIEVQKLWADAFKGHTSPLVPTFMMGGSGNGGVNAGTQFMELMNAKAMKDLSLDLGTRSGGNKK